MTTPTDSHKHRTDKGGHVTPVYIQNIQNFLNAARNYHASLKRYNIAVSSLYGYFAWWPMDSYPDLQQRPPELKRQ